MRAQIVLENVGIRFPNRVLFENVNWTLYEGMRVAFAGRNGSGKSTLLKILSGQLDPHEGNCTVVGKRQLKIGYLDQSLLDSAVLEAMNSKEGSASPMTYLKHRMHQTDELVAESQLEWEISRVLDGLGFTPKQLNEPMNRLSGGWLLRMFIGAALLDKPDCLLLDEPTNHLDISSIQWLEDFLREEYEGSLVIVTHDIDLQQRTTDSIAVIHGGHFYFRSQQKDYLSFMDSLKEEEQIIERSIAGIEKKIKEIEAFILRFRAKARMASRAQSKQKQMEKFEEEKRELQDRLARVKGFRFDLNFRFRMEHQGGKFPLSVKHMGFRYKPELPDVLKDVSLDIKRGQKVAIIGENGAGKTTLLNIFAERLKPTAGHLEVGHNVQMGYFGQHQLDELNLEMSVLDNLRVKAEGIGLEQLRGWLGAFGFQSDDEINKNAKVLSGGERARLALLRILASPCNVCLLDEPTNHLDIETKELLAKAIKSFEGSILFVSHDREFVRHLAERIIFVSVDHKVIDHLGNLESFMEKYPSAVRHLENTMQKKKAAPAPEKSNNDDGISYEERKKIKNRIRSLEKKLEGIETDIEDLGKEKEELQDKASADDFYTPANDEKRLSVFKRLEEIDSRLSSHMSEWERMGTELEDLKQKFGD